jgi:hypothetical protein
VREAAAFLADKLPRAHLLIAPGIGRLSAAERTRSLAALARLTAPGIRATLGAHLAALAVSQIGEVAASSVGGGKPSKLAGRNTLRSIAAIVEHHAESHSPKVAAMLLWLTGIGDRLCAVREGDTSADYLARLTRTIDKLTRSR